ncbi:MAG: proline dehydrogenase family protein [Acidobacteria bacterium]|nr:proline dehydrogenase family protein [Acidobacteriota bacterium]
MLRSLLLYLSEREFPKQFLLRAPFGRKLASRFIAGETLDDATRVARRLNAEGFDVTLDYLGESVHEAAAAEEATRVYLQILDRIASEKLRSHISIKLTQLGLDIDEAQAQRNLQALWERAAALGTFVRVDMESSAHTDATLRVFRAAQAPPEALGIVIQSYLRRSEKDVDELLRRGARVRLCKGAYKEPPDVAFPDKKDVDRNYVILTEKLLASGGYHALATHDPKMIQAAKDFARARGLGPGRYEFQMLYGIRRGLQRELVRRGYRVRVYVPFGRQWYAYFMRRLAERPANLLFLIRNLFRG